MTKKKLIDIDAEFDSVEFDEAEIKKATGLAKRSQNPEWHKNKTASVQAAMKRPEVKENQRKAQQEKNSNPEYRKRIAETNRKTAQTEEWKEASEAGLKKREANGWREKNYEKNMKMVATPEWQEAHKKAAREYSESGRAYINNRKVIEKRQQNPEYRAKFLAGVKKRTQDPEWQRKQAEACAKRVKCIVTPDGVFILKEATQYYAKVRNIKDYSAEGWLMKQRKDNPKQYYIISREEYIMLTGKDL